MLPIDVSKINVFTLTSVLPNGMETFFKFLFAANSLVDVLNSAICQMFAFLVDILWAIMKPFIFRRNEKQISIAWH